MSLQNPHSVPALPPRSDHLKLHLPLGVSASLLSYGLLTWEAAYRTAGLWDTGVRNLDWVASYYLKCHYQASDTPSANAFVAQVRQVKPSTSRAVP